MWAIVLEAAGALAVLLFIVWWTMFSGRRGGELPGELPEVLPDERAPAPHAETSAAGPDASAHHDTASGGHAQRQG